ncbi:3031_t:CDS:1, partial [Paraglomus brasilianum]
KENAKIPELEKKFAEIKSENVKLKQIIEENVKRDVRVEELEQKNKELEARLAVVEQSSVVVDGQTQNDSRSEDANASKEAILEMLPEISADDDSSSSNMRLFVKQMMWYQKCYQMSTPSHRRRERWINS